MLVVNKVSNECVLEIVRSSDRKGKSTLKNITEMKDKFPVF